MSNNQGDAATTAREQATEQTQTTGSGQDTQDAQSPAFEQQTGNTPPPSAERQTDLTRRPGTHHQIENAPATGTHATEDTQDAEPRAQTGDATAAEPQATGTDDQARAEQTGEANQQTQPAPSSVTPSPVESAASPAIAQPTGDPDEGVANSANVDTLTASQEATRKEFEPRPDVSDQGWRDLVPKLLALFNNNREQLARAIGLHRSTVDRWLNGKSRPNTSTILRMRRLAQERNIE